MLDGKAHSGLDAFGLRSYVVDLPGSRYVPVRLTGASGQEAGVFNNRYRCFGISMPKLRRCLIYSISWLLILSRASWASALSGAITRILLQVALAFSRSSFLL